MHCSLATVDRNLGTRTGDQGITGMFADSCPRNQSNGLTGCHSNISSITLMIFPVTEQPGPRHGQISRYQWTVHLFITSICREGILKWHNQTHTECGVSGVRIMGCRKLFSHRNECRDFGQVNTEPGQQTKHKIGGLRWKLKWNLIKAHHVANLASVEYDYRCIRIQQFIIKVHTPNRDKINYFIRPGY